ncbi:MAG: DUF2508 family protein [Oscillospiraceae bacterium]|nr:DUF2508 family protein [Oscillospiraceae bacterium]
MAKHQISPYTPTAAELQQELQDTGKALREAYEKFNYVSDAELVEACSYEISALKARYSYLLRRIKELSAPQSAENEAYIAASNMKGGKACQS